MKKIIFSFFLFLLTTGFVFAASCPTNFIPVSETGMSVSNNSCPVGSSGAGDAFSCQATSPPGSCLIFCPAGKYMATNDCVDCAAGTYSSSAATACTACPKGTYSVAGAAECTSCPAGTYGNKTGMAVCTSCAAGTYNPNIGSTAKNACKTCPSGTTSSPGAAYCNCPENNYFNNGACKACPAGATAPAGAAQCTCPANKYWSNGSCVACPAGSSSVSGAVSCKCAAGNYWDNGACMACPPGTVNPLPNGGGIDECHTCGAGFYAGTCTSCSTCPPFYPHSAEGSDSINDCYTNDLSGKYIATANATNAIDCPVGTIKTANVVYYGETSQCDSCVFNKYQDEPGKSFCKTCPVGANSNASGTYCDCPENQYWNNGTCLSCPAGSISSAGSSSCECSVGKYWVSGACQDCPVGTYNSTPGAGECTPCTNATYQDETGQSFCKDCPTVVNLNGAQSVKYDYAKYNLGTGNIECPYARNPAACPGPLHDTVEGCVAEFYYGENFIPGIIHHGKTNEYYSFYDPVAHTYNANRPAYIMFGLMNLSGNVDNLATVECDPGYYEANYNATVCQCPGNEYPVAILGPTYEEFLGDVCLPCPENTYSVTASAMDDSVCQPCPSDRPFSSAGSDELSDCGHILHYGDHKVYLRSEIKTNPSFRSLIGGAQFYGNMKCTDQSPSAWTFPGNNVPPRPHAWINVNGQTCLIYDDSAEFGI